MTQKSTHSHALGALSHRARAYLCKSQTEKYQQDSFDRNTNDCYFGSGHNFDELGQIDFLFSLTPRFKKRCAQLSGSLFSLATMNEAGLGAHNLSQKGLLLPEIWEGDNRKIGFLLQVYLSCQLCSSHQEPCLVPVSPYCC